MAFPRRRPRYGRGRTHWFEVWTAVLGLAFLALFVLCVIATVSIVMSWGEREPTFPAGEGALEGLRGIGLVFFPLAALVTLATGWWLAGDLLRSWLRRFRVRNREEG